MDYITTSTTEKNSSKFRYSFLVAVFRMLSIFNLPCGLCYNITFHSFAHLHAQNFIASEMSYNPLNSDRKYMYFSQINFTELMCFGIDKIVFQKDSRQEWVKECGWRTPTYPISSGKLKINNNNNDIKLVHVNIFFMTTVMIISFRTDRSEQTVQTQIRQSDQDLHCLQCSLPPLDAILYGKATLFKF